MEPAPGLFFLQGDLRYPQQWIWSPKASPKRW